MEHKISKGACQWHAFLTHAVNCVSSSLLRIQTAEREVRGKSYISISQEQQPLVSAGPITRTHSRGPCYLPIPLDKARKRIASRLTNQSAGIAQSCWRGLCWHRSTLLVFILHSFGSAADIFASLLQGSLSLLEGFPKWSSWLASRSSILVSGPPGGPVHFVGRPGGLGSGAAPASVPVPAPAAALPLVLHLYYTCTTPVLLQTLPSWPILGKSSLKAFRGTAVTPGILQSSYCEHLDVLFREERSTEQCLCSSHGTLCMFIETWLSSKCADCGWGWPRNLGGPRHRHRGVPAKRSGMRDRCLRDGGPRAMPRISGACLVLRRHVPHSLATLAGM